MYVQAYRRLNAYRHSRYRMQARMVGTCMLQVASLLTVHLARQFSDKIESRSVDLWQHKGIQTPFMCLYNACCMGERSTRFVLSPALTLQPIL